MNKYETILQEELKDVKDHNNNLSSSISTKTHTLGATGIAGGTFLTATGSLQGPIIIGGSAISAIAGSKASKKIENWESDTDNFNFRRTFGDYSEKLKETEKIGINHLERYNAIERPRFKPASTQNYKVTLDQITDGKTASELYNEIEDYTKTGEIEQYLSFQEQQDPNRFDLHLYDSTNPIIGFTGYTDQNLEEFSSVLKDEDEYF